MASNEISFIKVEAQAFEVGESYVQREFGGLEMGFTVLGIDHLGVHVEMDDLRLKNWNLDAVITVVDNGFGDDGEDEGCECD